MTITSTTAKQLPPERPVRRRSTHILAKLLCISGCLIFAAAAIGTGLDRQAQQSPSLAAQMPPLLAAHALSTRGEAEINAGQYQAALADGTAAVLRAPLDPGSSALLGAARLGLGDTAGAQSAMLVAGRMGWRVPLTQVYWMQQAAALRDYPVAALRLDALLRQHPWMLGRTALLAPVEATAEGRKAVADRLATAPPWLAPYARDVTDLPIDAVSNRAQVLAQIAARGLKVGCDLAAPPVNRLVDAARFGEAYGLWRGHCDEAGSGLLGDPDLAHLRATGARSYFEWDLVGSADVAMSLVPGAGQGQQIEIHNGSTFTRTIMRQLLPAVPGRYRLSWRAVTLGGKPAPQVAAALGCNPDPASRFAGLFDAGSGTWQADVAIGADCRAHWLAFVVLAGAPDLRLSAVRVEPLR